MDEVNPPITPITQMTPSGQAPPREPEQNPRSTASATLSWLRDLFLSVVIAIVVILFLYQPVRVEGTSMKPTLVDEERIFINKFVYRFGLADIGRGDVVVFWFPGDTSKSYIKRVIGVPGDTVEVKEGIVYVNGAKLAEAYVAEDYRDTASNPAKTLEPDQYFVLGDHRNSSNDSRSWGTVPRNYIYGKAVFVYWPLERLGVLR
jgi:signal peptidase I